MVMVIGHCDVLGQLELSIMCQVMLPLDCMTRNSFTDEMGQ